RLERGHLPLARSRGLSCMRANSSSRRRLWPWILAAAALLAALLLFLLRGDGPPEERGNGPRLVAPAASGGRMPVASASPALPPEPAAETPPPAVTLPPFAGRVLSSADGKAIPGAEVTFFAPEGASSVRTGPDGRFSFVPSRPGPHQLAAVLAEGFVPFGPEWGQSPIRLVAPAPRGMPELVVSLDPEVRLRGRVEAAAGGAPIPGAHVTLRVPGTLPGLTSPELGWTTDGRGEFSGSAPPDSVVVARAAGFEAAAEALRGGRTQTVTLRLKRAAEDAAP